MKYDRWGYMYWESKVTELANLSGHSRADRVGILGIPPEVHGAIFRDGLWDYLNAKLGTLFDEAEDEYVDQGKLQHLADELRTFSESVYVVNRGERTIEVGQQIAPVQASMNVTVSHEALRAFLDRMIAFVLDARAKGEDIAVSL